jgi:hypothetical protein
MPPPVELLQDDELRARVCNALCAHAGLAPLWSSSGPTAEAEPMRHERRMSIGRDAIVKTAFVIWDGDPHFRVSELLAALQGEHLAPVASLLTALSLGRDAIEVWIADSDAR